MRIRSYDKELKETIIKLHLEQKKTIASLSEEYGISPSTISRWITVSKNRSYIASERKSYRNK